jgi:hypothetical protein
MELAPAWGKLMNLFSPLRINVLALTIGMTLSSAALAGEPSFQKREPTTEYTAPLSQTTQPSYVPQSVALSGPPTLAYHDDEPVPPGYTPVQRTRRGAIIAGAVVLGSLYLLSMAAASAGADESTSRSNELGALWIPVLGPFIQMGRTETAIGKYALTIDGLGQAAGAGLLLYGLVSPKTVLIRNDLTSAKPKIRPVPVITAHSAGLGLSGTF